MEERKSGDVLRLVGVCPSEKPPCVVVIKVVIKIIMRNDKQDIEPDYGIRPMVEGTPDCYSAYLEGLYVAKM